MSAVEPQDCDHIWGESSSYSYSEPVVPGLACELCGTSPEQVLAAEGRVTLPCGHDVTEAETIQEHIEWAPIAEGTLKSCDLLMPDWGD